MYAGSCLFSGHCFLLPNLSIHIVEEGVYSKSPRWTATLGGWGSVSILLGAHQVYKVKKVSYKCIHFVIHLCDFQQRQVQSVLKSIKTMVGKRAGSEGMTAAVKVHKRSVWVTEILRILLGAWATWIYTFVNSYIGFHT